MYKKYEYLSDEEIKEVEDVCANSIFIPLEIEENNAEPFDEQVIRNNMNDKEFHKKFRAKLDELNEKYSKYDANNIK